MSLTHNPYSSAMSQYSFVPEYQLIIQRTMDMALNRFNRVCALRFDLRFPEHHLYDDPAVISRFIDSFKVRLKVWDNQRASKHPIGFSYLWCREQSGSQNWHYHVVFLFNKDAVCGFGRNSIENSSTYSRILSAWASAIGISPENAVGLVHICKNGAYWLNKSSATYSTDLELAMERFSYLAKRETKQFDDGNRNFGSSQQLYMS
jgi:hypothetical protein